MRTKLSRLLSLLLCLVMVVGLLPTVALAAAPYTITFDANGGRIYLSDDETRTMTTNADGKVATLPRAVRDGFRSEGWYTAREGGKYVIGGTSSSATTFTENTTVYARWTELPELGNVKIVDGVLSWDAVTNANRYVVGIDGATKTVAAPATSVNLSECGVTLTPGQTYTVTVYAYKYSGTSLHDPLTKTWSGNYTAPGSSATKIPVPTARDGLVYNGELQLGVSSTNGCSIADCFATDAGEYTATATLQSGYVWSDGSTGAKQIRWSIAKADPKAEDFDFTPPANLVYDGNAKTAAVAPKSGINGMGKVTVSYWAEVSPGTSILQNELPKTSGKYLVLIQVAEGTNYNAFTGGNRYIGHNTWNFEIKAGAPTITKSPAPIEGLIYDGSWKALITPGSAANGTMQYKIGLGRWSEDIPKALIAGTYEVYYRVAGDTNYSDLESSDYKLTVTIGKANQAPLSFTCGDQTTYGTDLALSVSGGSTDGAVTYEIVSGGTGGAAISGSTLTPTKVGTVKVKATMAGNDVYDAVSAETEITIAKASVTKPEADTTRFVYTGSEQTYTIAASDLYTVAGSKQTNAGTYEVKVALTDKANYQWTDNTTDDLKYDFVIAKASVTKPAADTTRFVYTGSEQTYAIAASDLYTVADNKQTNAGTYEVKVELKDKANYQWTDNTTDDLKYDFVIAKASVTKPEADTTRFVYTGSEQTYTIAASDLYTVAGSKQTNAGTYEVTVALKDKANYQWADKTTDDLKFEFIIAKAVPAYTVPTGLWSYFGMKLSQVKLPDGWQWDEPADTRLHRLGTMEFQAVFTPADTANYQTVTKTLQVRSLPWPDVTAPAMDFTDVSRAMWSFDDIAYVYQKGLMQGTGYRTFSPGLTTDRAMIVTILYRLAGSPAVSYEKSFDDVPVGQWYSRAFAWARANGIVEGYGSGKVGPNDRITREQLAAILYRYMQYKGMGAVTTGEHLQSFSDHGKVSGYAVRAMNWAVANGLINGADNKLMPTDGATREQLAAILHRFCENVVK